MGLKLQNSHYMCTVVGAPSEHQVPVFHLPQSSICISLFPASSSISVDGEQQPAQRHHKLFHGRSDDHRLQHPDPPSLSPTSPLPSTDPRASSLHQHRRARQITTPVRQPDSAIDPVDVQQPSTHRQHDPSHV
ncbi:hypothetical protein ACLOJK_019153 [Asimina triloba]